MQQKIPRRDFLVLAAGALPAPYISWGAPEPPAMLDHVLLGCTDLTTGINFVEKHTGVRAAFGGVHPGAGTRKRFALARLESLSRNHRARPESARVRHGDISMAKISRDLHPTQASNPCCCKVPTCYTLKPVSLCISAVAAGTRSSRSGSA